MGASLLAVLVLAFAVLVGLATVVLIVVLVARSRHQSNAAVAQQPHPPIAA